MRVAIGHELTVLNRERRDSETELDLLTDKVRLVFFRIFCDPKKVSVALLAVAVVLCIACAFSQDKAAAETVARRVHESMQLGDFGAVYKESAPRLKTASAEFEFVDYFREIQNDLGSLKEAHEVAYETRLDSRIGRAHAFMFELEYYWATISDYKLHTSVQRRATRSLTSQRPPRRLSPT